MHWWSAWIAGRNLFFITTIPDWNFSCLSCYNLHCWHSLTAAFMPCLCLPGMLESLEGIWSCPCIKLLKGKRFSSHPCCLQDSWSGVHGCWRDAAAPSQMQPLGQSERRPCPADSCAALWEAKMGVAEIVLPALRCVPLMQCFSAFLQEAGSAMCRVGGWNAPWKPACWLEWLSLVSAGT